MGRLYNNGETCVSANRFIVTDKVCDAFVDAFVAQMKDIIMGDPTDEDSQLGPLSSQKQFDTVTRTALAVNVVVAAQDTDALLQDLSEGLEHTFGIAHSTIQIEREPCGTTCFQTVA